MVLKWAKFTYLLTTFSMIYCAVFLAYVFEDEGLIAPYFQAYIDTALLSMAISLPILLKIKVI